MILKLPEIGRPRNVYYRKCALGVDLPATFVHELRSLDNNLYPVFHPYRVLWDTVINDYAGEIEDPRYQIEYKYGELNFGFVLTDGHGRPVPDGHWHIWRWCEPAIGWAHVINIDSKDLDYLNLLVKRLWLQAKYNEQYGHRGYMKLLEEQDMATRSKKMEERNQLMNDIADANAGMMARARSNFERGVVNPTNPTKEIISSYSGQRNKTKLVRPIDDREGGLILPDSWD